MSVHASACFLALRATMALRALFSCWLLLAVLGGLCASESVPPPLVLTSASPATVSTAVNTTVALSGSGFVLGTPAGWTLRCRIASACPLGGSKCTTFTHEGYSGGAIYANATVLNDTHATCVAHAVFVPGPGLLSVCILQTLPGSPWLCNAPSNTTRISYYKPVDAVLSRRPYINESQDELLVTVHPIIAGKELRLQASLAFAGKRWDWVVTPADGTAVVPLDLAGLPVTINADLRVDVDYGAASNLTIWRRLMRTPLPASAKAAAAVVQVDHSTMSLRVGGDTFQGSGWFVGIPKWPPAHWLPCTQPPINTTSCAALWLTTIRPRAALGTLSMIMPVSGSPHRNFDFHVSALRDCLVITVWPRLFAPGGTVGVPRRLRDPRSQGAVPDEPARHDCPRRYELRPGLGKPSLASGCGQQRHSRREPLCNSRVLHLRRLLPDWFKPWQRLEAGQALQPRQVARTHQDHRWRHSVQQHLDVDGRPIRADRT